MNVQRIRTEIWAASQHFPNIETFTTLDGSIYIKAALQTAVGQAYVIKITFTGYPSEQPKVFVLAPEIRHSPHMYPGYICYMHPNMWNPAKHDLKFVLFQAAVWLNKHEVYKVRGVWPGPQMHPA